MSLFWKHPNIQEILLHSFNEDKIKLRLGAQAFANDFGGDINLKKIIPLIAQDVLKKNRCSMFFFSMVSTSHYYHYNTTRVKFMIVHERWSKITLLVP